MIKRTTAFVVLFAVFALVLSRPTYAQRGMTKGEYYDYLVRSGQATSSESASKTLGPSDIKLSVLDIGNVRARIRNTGTLGYDRDLLCYEFPFNSTITYRWTLGPMIAGKIGDRKYVSGAALGAVRGTSEDEFRPLKGYDSGEFVAEQNLGIAFSDIPASWPSSWPTLDEALSQNGDYIMNQAARTAYLNNPSFDPVANGTALIGSSGFPGIVDGELRAPREGYFVITDNDPSEGGAPVPLNVRVDVWALQWDDFVNRNFIIYKLLFTNVGNETIEDVYVGIHDDPDAPEQGSNEWTDDYAYLIPPGKDADGDGVPDADADVRSDVDGDGLYTKEDSLLWNTLYLWDGDDQSEGFVPSGVGWVGLKFLETPDNPDTGEPRGVTSLDIFQYSAAPNTDSPAYDQMAGILHVGLDDNDPQQGGGTPIMEPDWPDGAPDDVFKIKNSYGPDITVVAGSGPYTLEPGQSLPFTFASVHGSSQTDVLNNAKLTQILFNSNYKAASGPPTPQVVAVPQNGQVTLYWDDTAEKGYYADGTFGDPLTGNNAFEGYKIFRSSDGGLTWGTAITDIYGGIQGFIPLAIYDLKNGIKGESTTRRYFDLGQDSGLQHKYVDTNVQNGKEYLYAVVAYDSQDGPVPPLESPINAANPDAPGDNTVRVRPMARSAGIISGQVDQEALKVAGNADIESLDIELVDPSALVSGIYRITFGYNENGGFGYTVTRNGETVVNMNGNPMSIIDLYDSETDFAPVFDGIRVYVENVSYGLKNAEQTTGTSGLELDDLNILGGTPETLAADYELRFTGEDQVYTDWDNGTPVTAPFEIIMITPDGETKITAEVFDSRWGANENGAWDPGEWFAIVTSPYQGSGGWEGNYSDDYPFYGGLTDATPAVGDVFRIETNKPLSEADIFEFEVQGPVFTKQTLEEDIETITVVPNPFVVSSAYEQGRYGVQRELQFHQLPEVCSIRIFTTAGELLQVIEHNGGSIEPWNLQTYNGQEISFGVYLYYVETPEGVTTTGKFAVIK